MLPKIEQRLYETCETSRRRIAAKFKIHFIGSLIKINRIREDLLHGHFFENFIKSWKISLIYKNRKKNSNSSNQGAEVFRSNGFQSCFKHTLTMHGPRWFHGDFIQPRITDLTLFAPLIVAKNTPNIRIEEKRPRMKIF